MHGEVIKSESAMAPWFLYTYATVVTTLESVFKEKLGTYTGDKAKISGP